MKSNFVNSFATLLTVLLFLIISCKKENIIDDPNPIQQPNPSEGTGSNLTAFSFENRPITSWKFNEQYKIYTITVPTGNLDITKIKLVYPADSYTRKPASGTVVDFSKPLHFQVFNSDGTLNKELSSYIRVVKVGETLSNKNEVDKGIFTPVAGVKELAVDNQKNEITVTINKGEPVDSLKTQLNAGNGIITFIEYDATGKFNQNAKLIVIAEDGTVRKYGFVIKEFDIDSYVGIIKYLAISYPTENITAHDTTYLKYDNENRLTKLTFRNYSEGRNGNLSHESKASLEYDQKGNLIKCSFEPNNEIYQFEYENFIKLNEIAVKYGNEETIFLVKYLANNIVEILLDEEKTGEGESVRYYYNDNSEVIKAEYFYKGVLDERITVIYEDIPIPKEMQFVLSFASPYIELPDTFFFAPILTPFKHYPKSFKTKYYDFEKESGEDNLLFDYKLNSKGYPVSINTTATYSSTNGSTSDNIIEHQFGY